ncbi:nucleotidyltransferase family protein [Frigidibacter sp. MR17.24]|uniref:nucleotidyltransferase family protein n=1 Tax=Frigidibacter sp. MR17.24 TaxID=3127345 RepID=UPI0030131DF6
MRTPPVDLTAPRSLMLYAAGFGTRMGALTATRPKPMVPVAGRPLIDHALALAEGMDLRILANTHYLPGQIAAHLEGRAEIAPEPEILETGGGLAAARDRLSDPCFTLNTDAVWTGPNALRTLRAAWDPARMDALLLLVPRERATGHTGRGDFLVGPDGALTRGPGAVYTGAQILTLGLLDGVSERKFSNNVLWDIAAARGRLHGVIHPGGWCDVGRPESIALAESLLEAADG